MKFDRKRLKDMREAKGLSQAALGKKTGHTRQTVYDWEKGNYNPSLEDIGKIGAALGVAGIFFINQEDSQ